MRLRLAPALLAAAALGSGFAVESGPGALEDAPPAMRVASVSPFTVTAAGFVPGERVRLVVRTTTTVTRSVLVGARGGFRVTIPGLALDRCESAFVIATGSRGSRAAAAKLAKPRCLPVRSARRPAESE